MPAAPWLCAGLPGARAALLLQLGALQKRDGGFESPSPWRELSLFLRQTFKPPGCKAWRWPPLPPLWSQPLHPGAASPQSPGQTRKPCSDMLKQPRSPPALGSPASSSVLEHSAPCALQMPAQALPVPTQRRMLGGRWALHHPAEHPAAQVTLTVAPAAALTHRTSSIWPFRKWDGPTGTSLKVICATMTL